VRWILFAACALALQAGAQAAEHDTKSDVTLARMYRHGAGAAVDKARAAQLFERAAQAGDADAAFTLANMLRDGEGVPVDAARARFWLQRAADGESPEALQQLGMEEADPARAAQLFREAAHALTHQVR
jgi:TPR repeat protein